MPGGPTATKIMGVFVAQIATHPGISYAILGKRVRRIGA
jgi:hypothetical protein